MIYRLVLALRHLCYDKGWKKVSRAAVPTVCVGNITVGGTGKTPHVELILRTLLGSDTWASRNLAVLSRGYKRKSKGFQLVQPDASAAYVGDEPLQLARKFPMVTVAVDKNRVRGCEQLVQGSKAGLIILDDAFQYRDLQADVNMVLVDYNRPIFKDKLLPWGRLRDLPSRISKAQMVIVTKCPSEVDAAQREDWRRKLGLTPEQQLFFTTLAYGEPESVFPEADKRYLYAQRLVLVSGIANDAPLRSYLSDTYKIASRLAFPDHHAFSRRDIRAILSALKENPTACVMTTEKDAQRLRDVKEKYLPKSLRERLFYLPVQATFLSPEEHQAFSTSF